MDREKVGQRDENLLACTFHMAYAYPETINYGLFRDNSINLTNET